ncbi:hypothetical protein DFH09DRAFT_1284256 [Mycena vulgaris]|nr:hypothetical protein DFH09DRAFT_1284256 [Mycena vulgaris]
MPFDVWGLKPRRPPVLLRDATLMSLKSLRRPIKRFRLGQSSLLFSRIRELTLCQGNEEVWELLPLLTFLSLRPDFIHSPTFSRSSFPALRTLELTCNRNPNDALCNSNHLVSFIKSCENWKLESISVELAPTPAILEAIHAHCAHSTLTRLEVGIGLYHYTHAFIWNYDSTIVPSSAMQPLLSFTRLRALSLKSPVGIDLDTTTFWRMASAWPDLESLALTADIPAPKLGLAFDALRALAENCPRLRSLSIPISAVSKIPGFCVVLPPKERRVALVAAHPWLSAHAVVAEFASHLYPYPQMGADDVHWQDNEGDGEEESDEDGDEHENGDGCGSGGESGEEVGYGDEDSDCSWE